MSTYEQEYLSELPLRLKAPPGWRHSRIRIRDRVPEMGSHEGSSHTDYLGPDIDLGFRISKFASPATIAVSLDLVDVILGAPYRDRLNFYLVGREELRGVHFRSNLSSDMGDPGRGAARFHAMDIEDHPMVARAINEGPTESERLKRTIDGARLYLRKMHGGGD